MNNKIVYATKKISKDIIKDVVKPDVKRFNFLKSWMMSNYYWAILEPTIPRISILDIVKDFNNDKSYSMEINARTFGLPAKELYYLSRIVDVLKPARIFEFGTFQGSTTRQLAEVATQAEIVTIDLPNDDSHMDLEQGVAGDFRVGSAFHGMEIESRITQILCDSLKYDFSEHYGQFDFIFIDAAHNYENVIADSREAIKLIESSSGVIVWDDYTTWLGVNRAVAELAQAYPIKYIEGTRFAILYMEDV